MHESALAPGHFTCAGCGASIAERMLFRFLEEKIGRNYIVAHGTSCMEVTTTAYPFTSYRVPWFHLLFENTAAVASGIEAAIKAEKRDIKVVAIAGDGGTYDIGIRSLSGMLERGHDVLYVVYDNEAYMNTGIQRSSATPMGAWTTTSQVGKAQQGNVTWKKDIVAIAAAHNIPYAASASIGFPHDFRAKVHKALEYEGPKLIAVHAPCPTGWRHPTDKTIEIARLAVETGLWPLVEYEQGRFRITYKPKFVALEEYVKLQGRFKHLLKSEKGKRILEAMKQRIEAWWEQYLGEP